MTPPNDLVPREDIGRFSKFFGNKTLNLKLCVDRGFNVPAFVALPSSLSEALFKNESLRDMIGKKAARILRGKRYAVRSSALIEDSENSSFAGQFSTKIDLVENELEQAIKEVLDQADRFLKGDLDKFSIIIQEYIAPDISGVAFTRNPGGGREMILEYGYCPGEKIVSGQIKPTRTAFYWDGRPETELPAPLLRSGVVQKFKDIEKIFGAPQDIEWCIKDGAFYLLQTRNITTLSAAQYEQILFLEENLPQSKQYFFEKTEISEIAPRPAKATLGLLEAIYANDGPVDHVYKKFGVQYKPTDFLSIIGNELFVDREKEIHGILPSYSYLRNKERTPKLSSLYKLLPTIKNLFALNTIRTAQYERIFDELKNRLGAKLTEKTSVAAAVGKFLSDYELIFETNLLSGLSIKKAGRLLKNEPVGFSEILNSRRLFIDVEKFRVDPPKTLKGNSLELTDTTAFTSFGGTDNPTNDKVAAWWDNVQGYKKNIFRRAITEAIHYDRLREFGRWLTAARANVLRNALLGMATDKKFKDPSNIFFADLYDLLNNKAIEGSCIKNKEAHKRFDRFALPSSLSSSLIIKQSAIIGVSSGAGSGILQNKENIGAGKNYILYTEMLSPDLTEYFDKISGIISNNGGVLSHLAIMAREKNIPVVVGYSLNDGKFKLGDMVQIDGGSGSIKLIE